MTVHAIDFPFVIYFRDLLINSLIKIRLKHENWMLLANSTCAAALRLCLECYIYIELGL